MAKQSEGAGNIQTSRSARQKPARGEKRLCDPFVKVFIGSRKSNEMSQTLDPD